MKLLALMLAGYLGIALETSVVPEVFGSAHCGVLLWPLLPYVAFGLSRPTSVLFATGYGLVIDALGSGRLGVCSILCVLAVLTLQRLGSSTWLSTWSRCLLVMFITSIALSTTLLVIESVLNWNSIPPIGPSRLLQQLLGLSLVGAVCGGLVSTPWRILEMKRTPDPFA